MCVYVRACLRVRCVCAYELLVASGLEAKADIYFIFILNDPVDFFFLFLFTSSF